MAVSGAVRIVSVGAPVAGGGHPDATAIVTALASAGIPVGAHVVIEDDETALEETLRFEGITAIVADVGGSAGDSVRRVLSRITGARLLLNERMHALLDAHYGRLDRPVPRAAERLALLPQGATVAEGDAPVWILETDAGAWVVFLRGRVGEAVEPTLVALARERIGARGGVAVRTFKTAGVSAEEIEDRLVDRLSARDVALTTLPGEGEVWVRVRARGATAAAAAQRLTEVEPTLVELLGADCYGRDGDTLEGVVGTLLNARGQRLAVAESCTGGLLGHRITAVPGSSSYFERSLMLYSNRAKAELLGADEAVLRTHGAVSAACAEAMARRVAERAGVACGLAVTGIAGPGGGTPAKPVGTVFVGLAAAGKICARRFRFSGDRGSVKWQASVMALDMLRRALEASP
jgi:nicotinamide-nucleotide amidase